MNKKITNIETNEIIQAGSLEPLNNIEIGGFEDVSINPFIKEEIFLIGCKEDENKESNRLFKKVYKNKIKIIRTIENIPLENLVEFYEKDIIFKPHDENAHGVLKDSISKYGLFSPIILWEYVSGRYYILSGYERVRCYVELYNEVGEEYRNVPSFVLGEEEINDLIAREIYIDSNISQRKLSPMEISKALITKCGIKLKEKEKRNDLNIMNEMAIDFNMSRSSLYNYKKLEKLIDPFAYLLDKGKINLKNAIKVSEYPEEIQVKLLTEIGINDIDNVKLDLFRIKDLNNKLEVDAVIEIIKETKYPFFSKFIVKCATRNTGEVLKKLEEALKRFPKEYFVKLMKPELII